MELIESIFTEKIEGMDVRFSKNEVSGQVIATTEAGIHITIQKNGDMWQNVPEKLPTFQGLIIERMKTLV